MIVPEPQPDPLPQYQPDPEVVAMKKRLEEEDAAYWAEVARKAKAAEDRNCEAARLEDLRMKELRDRV